MHLLRKWNIQCCTRRKQMPNIIYDGQTMWRIGIIFLFCFIKADNYGYTTERKIKLTPTKYFNAWLLHRCGRFATNPEYLFFAQFITEQKKVSDSINIAQKKVHGQFLTASKIRSSVQTLQNLICQDQAYLLVRQIPGNPLAGNDLCMRF